ncbi:MAG: cytidine deaminase, partial [Desulfovibrio sp.]
MPSPLLAALLLALLVVFPGPETAQAQVQEIKINYGFSREFPPFSYERDGEPAGFEVELLQAVLSEVENLEITMKPLDWIQVQMDLSDGVIELTTGMARTEQRMLLYDFSDQPTVSIKVRLFTQTTNRISNPTQLRGRRVAVKEGSLYQRVLEEIGGMNIKLYP